MKSHVSWRRWAWVGAGLVALVVVIVPLLSSLSYMLNWMIGRPLQANDFALNHAIERSMYLPVGEWGEHPFYYFRNLPQTPPWCEVSEFVSAQSIDVYNKCRRRPKITYACSFPGLYWLRFSRCREVTLPISYWESDIVKERIVRAIQNPCVYLSGKQPDPSEVHSGSVREWLARPTPKPQGYSELLKGEFDCKNGATSVKEQFVIMLYDDTTHELIRKEKMKRN